MNRIQGDKQMEKKYEKRGNYNVAYYEIPVDAEMKKAAMDFAQRIILSDNQYSRLLPNEVRSAHDISMQHKIEIQRTYMGKLGEIAFLKFLQEKKKNVKVDGMFEVFEGQDNVDDFDFITAAGRSVDVKTGFRSIHKRLLVNTEQFDRIPKDYYVAVKLDALDVDSKQKLVDWDQIATAQILGYAEYNFMKGHAAIADFGEGPARWLLYNRLMGIDRLVTLF